MRLTCPSCETSYEVSSILTAGRRAVRCARCGHLWDLPEDGPIELQALPEEPEPPPIPVMSVEPRPERQKRESPHGHGGLWAAWLATFIVLGVAVWAAVAWRNNLMHEWPPSTRVYSTLGLHEQAGTSPPGTPAPAAGAPAASAPEGK